MAESKQNYTNKAYYADFENRPADVPADFEGLGYYQRSSLQDIIDNFIISYIGDDKILNKVPDYEVSFWAQRGLQEFSYDVLHSEKSVEIELGSALQFPLPQDYVNYTRVSCIGPNGEKHTLLPVKGANDPTAILQDSDYSFLYDSEDDTQKAAKSELATRYQDRTNSANSQEAQNYYSNNYNGDNFSYFNKRYGSNPESMNSAKTFFVDTARGIIFFDGSFGNLEDNIIVLDYISDGLSDSGDLTKVYIPKLAEDALYAFILYNLCKVRPASASLVPLYKKEASAKLRNAKIRLTNYRSEELAQVMRNKAKWIKH